MNEVRTLNFRRKPEVSIILECVWVVQYTIYWTGLLTSQIEDIQWVKYTAVPLKQMTVQSLLQHVTKNLVTYTYPVLAR